MSSFRIRPRFRQELDIPPKEIQAQIKSHVKESDPVFVQVNLEGFMILKIKPEDQHFWSPQLTLHVEKNEEEDYTEIRGLYGPNPTVWAAFTYGYLAIGVLILFIGMYGLSLAMLGKPAPILWVVAGLAVTAVVMYFVAQTGQKLGAEQTFLLHHFYEDAVKQRVHVN